ncbi:hypothetical protein [Flavobacterium defluvii]|uniref:Binding domain-containing protein, N-terminal n=1 Tax=Flavobacterium defluvii TaxID=370979 RepID=A0A1M5LZC7_9FLAO|nr:hypothetical protein [Flavobacterium defluvii]SHG70407.1 hypothetical protein SAMN05443663_103506 [Flavobacterium defluvii]
MKTRFLSTLFTMLSFLIISCSSDQNDGGGAIGGGGDPIKLSNKKVTFSSEANSVTITSQSKWWKISDIRINDERFGFNSEIAAQQSFVLQYNEFKIERKEGTTIIININKNTTNQDRNLIVTLQEGNYYDNINIIQSK